MHGEYVSDSGLESERSSAVPGPAGTGRARLHSLTGLRFFAASGVVAAHAMMLDPADPPPEVVGWLATSSVTLFFILSGYVLTHSWRPDDTARGFWRRQAAKIVPNHALTWFTALLVAGVSGTALATLNAGAAADAASLFLVHTWVGPAYALGGNVVAWSLAAEALFYFLFPALIPLVLRLTRRGCLILAGASLAVLWALPPFCALVIDPRTMTDAMSPGSEATWFLYVLPVSRLPQFLLGMALARLSAIAPELPRVGVLRAGVLLSGTLVVGTACLPDAFMCSAATTFSLALLIHAVSGLDLRGERSLLRSRTAVFLGEISFALYLVHFQILDITDHLGGEYGCPRAATLAAGLALALLASWLLYATVERPFMRRFARPRTPARRVRRGVGRASRPQPR